MIKQKTFNQLDNVVFIISRILHISDSIRCRSIHDKFVEYAWFQGQ